MPEKRLRLLRFGLGDELVEVIRDGGEFGGRGRVCALVGRRCGEFGLLAAELLQTGVEAGQAFVAALGGELALFEGLEVALECLFGARDLGADRGESPFECRSLPFAEGWFEVSQGGSS